MNFAMLAGFATVAGRITFKLEITVAGIAATTSDDFIKTKELGATSCAEIENCVIKITELYRESEDNVARIVTIPTSSNVTTFPVTVALVKSKELYVHAPVLLMGLVGSTISYETLLSDLFVICSGPS